MMMNLMWTKGWLLTGDPSVQRTPWIVYSPFYVVCLSIVDSQTLYDKLDSHVLQPLNATAYSVYECQLCR